MARFSETVKKVRKSIMEKVLAEGTVPLREELRREHSLSLAELDLVFRDLEAGIVVAAQNDSHQGIEYFQEEKLAVPAPALGEIFYARPFASFKNHYRIAVDGEQRWHGECAVECCGVSGLFPGREVVVRSVCRQSKEPVEICARDGVILDYSPKTLRVHVGVPVRFFPDDVLGWCDYNSFFGCEEAADEWRRCHPEVKGVTRDPVAMSHFVAMVGKGRLGYDYRFTLPVLRVLFEAKKYGFTRPAGRLSIHIPDFFWMPTLHTLFMARRKGYKNFTGLSWW